jgi:hypothetical protein
MTIHTDWNLPLTADDILRGQGADPQVVRKRKPALVAASERALSEGLSLLHPVAFTGEVRVLAHRHERILVEGGAKLTGSLVTRHLTGAERLVAAVCTIGAELEEAISHSLATDPLHALALDGLGNAAVEVLAQQLCGRIGDLVGAEGLQASTPLSPGSPEWPVETGQPQIFALLDPAKAGIRLTSGGMMLPKKSVSFVIGLGADMSQADLCDVCSLKESCRYRHE